MRTDSPRWDGRCLARGRRSVRALQAAPGLELVSRLRLESEAHGARPVPAHSPRSPSLSFLAATPMEKHFPSPYLYARHLNFWSA